jgi:hypothetical protein
VLCYGGAVSWESCKQPTAAASTMDAMYQACSAAAREALSCRKFLLEFELLSSALRLDGALHGLCDNQAALSLSMDRKETKRVKHIYILHHIVCFFLHVIMLQVESLCFCTASRRTKCRIV